MGIRAELWAGSGGSEKVESNFCLWQELVPQVHRKNGVDAAQASDKMVFECPNGTFRGVSPVYVWRCKLKINLLHLEELFKVLGSFIVKSV